MTPGDQVQYRKVLLRGSGNTSGIRMYEHASKPSLPGGECCGHETQADVRCDLQQHNVRTEDAREGPDVICNMPGEALGKISNLPRAVHG